jgi:hypothetical protein
MKIKTVTCSLGYTVNLGNYSNQKRELSATADVEEGETPEDAYEKLNLWVMARVMAERKKLNDWLKSKEGAA